MNSVNQVIKYIENRYADPICAIDWNETSCILGSMMGRSVYFSILEKRLIIWSETNNEHISGAMFSIARPKDKFNISIGDESVITYTFNSQPNPEFKLSPNYESDGEHNSNCGSCFTLLYDIYLLRLFLHLPENNSSKSEFAPVEYIVTNIDNSESDQGRISMTNYAVPFDYDGKRFIWIDFWNDKQREFNLYNWIAKTITFKYSIPKDFPHISHLKLLPNNKWFLVKNYNICEIRNEKFEVEQEYIPHGKEVIACDWMDLGSDNGVEIVTWDWDGNINSYNSIRKSIEWKLNLFHWSGISQEEKDQQFFSMGYPYFIRVCKSYYAVTTDYGCYIIKK